MPFPDAKRVIYQKNPLERVICQLRFPPILKIETEVPAKFQEDIREEFPGFKEKQETVMPILKGIQPEASIGALQQLVPSSSKNYEFTSDDGFWHVNLTRTFLALTCTKYERRSLFQQKLALPLQSLIEVYKPAHFVRVGLRYVDVIKRSVLGLEGVEWKELLQPHILGLLGAPNGVSQEIQNLEAIYQVRLEDGSSMVRIIIGLVDWPEKNEECFKIDTDFFNNGKIAISDVISSLDYFHIRASRLIQWLITEKLHAAMEPKEL